MFYSGRPGHPRPGSTVGPEHIKHTHRTPPHLDMARAAETSHPALPPSGSKVESLPPSENNAEPSLLLLASNKAEPSPPPPARNAESVYSDLDLLLAVTSGLDDTS